ncbi:MAG: TadE/TadG family type IV pilus assembly protein, partial [Pirellulaceae bacterium]
MKLQKHSRRLGAVTIEMAFVLPLVFLLFLGGIEMARLQMIRHLADNAAYEAARNVMVPGASVAEAEKVANDIMKVAGISGAKITVTPNPIKEDTKIVKVSLQIPAKSNLWTAATFGEYVNLGTEISLMTERGPMTMMSAVVVPPPPPPPP